MSELKLTLEQQKIAEEYKTFYKNVNLCTKPTDRALVEETFRKIYKKQKENGENVNLNPTFHWEDSPLKGAKKVIELLKTHPETKEKYKDYDVNKKADITNILSFANYGSFEAYWVAYYDFENTVLNNNRNQEEVNLTKTICQECGVFWTFNENIIITEKPIRITVKDNKIHSYDGEKCIEYKDGTGIYATNGFLKKSLLEAVLDSCYEEPKNNSL